LSDDTQPPLAGRRLYFVGIGGAGMSAYANFSRDWGADVRGWDVQQTRFMETLSGIEIDIGGEPEPPEGFEVVVSSAHEERAQGRSRAEFLAELVALRRAIVVGGAHGKTTTAAMIAFTLRELGRDPAWIVGGVVGQLGGNAGTGSGWLVVEGDESDRSIALLRPEIAVVTNVELDHHAAFSSTAELESFFDDWTAAAPHVVRGWELEPAMVELAVPGEHNRLNAACALAALELAGVDRGEAERVLQEFRGAGRRLEDHGETRGGLRLFDDYGHHPAEIAATLAAARELAGEGRVIVLFQPHLYSRTLHLAAELGRALAGADVAAITDVYPAREESIEGVSGKLVVDRLCERRPGMSVAWTPTLEQGIDFLARTVRSGDLVLTVGAGDVDRALTLLRERLAA
jgi:UDP-N-acetylmuramate--alanine ligase